MHTLAAVVEGKADLADILFLVAFVVAVVGAVVAFTERSVVMTLLCVAVGLAALAWFVL